MNPAPATLTKYYRFSASYARNGRIHGHNYRLGVTFDAMSPEAEQAVDDRLQRLIKDLVDSRDLGTDVPMLAGLEISDENLLRALWGILSREAGKERLNAVSLERDSRTITTLTSR